MAGAETERMMNSSARDGARPRALVFRAVGKRVMPSRADIVREVLLVMGLFVAYQLARWVAIDDVRSAFANARLIIEWEREANIYLERSVQTSLIRFDTVVEFLSAYYVWGLYPFMVGLGAITFVANRDLYRWARNAIFISWAIALIGYVLFPVAPPRFFLDQGFIDTVYGSSINLAPPWTNHYAAMPSMHQGFAVIFAVTAYRLFVPAVGWPLACALPVVMFLSIVATGNHFVVDAAAGIVVVTFGMLAAWYWERRQAERRAPAPAYAWGVEEPSVEPRGG
jgi:hypothetical protein